MAEWAPTFPVGMLGSDYDFPSDHLPVCAIALLPSEALPRFVVISWNILNSAFMHYVSSKNDQGLKGSAITRDNVPSTGPESAELTVREERTIKYIVEMITRQPQAPVLCLQEVSASVLQHLPRYLPDSMQVFSTPAATDHLAMIYDSKLLDKTAQQLYKFQGEHKYVMQAEFAVRGDTSTRIRVVNVHVPGGGQRGQRGRAEMAQQLAAIPCDMLTLLVGDFNATPDDLEQVFERTPRQPCALRRVTGARPTHINTRKQATVYDIVWLADAADAPAPVQAHEMDDEELLPGALINVTRLMEARRRTPRASE
eukprot:TRINITY_DN15802_c0_g1_i1.p1 TRINITY_DN15802_c0_g1~~TRINITY_DN15802_c0_g1_i1.p1  ORF type:complete len:358 (+),score=68.12 TRINITY_DN15802_c0_g1_i1:139-1074(+)